MPLPAITKYGAKQCQCKSKRTGQPCLNAAAYGCVSCRMHGAHRSRKVLKGALHPQYKNGTEMKSARLERSKKIEALRNLADLGNHIDLFYKKIKFRGRPPTGYISLDLYNSENLATIIKKLQ